MIVVRDEGQILDIDIVKKKMGQQEDALADNTSGLDFLLDIQKPRVLDGNLNVLVESCYQAQQAHMYFSV